MSECNGKGPADSSLPDAYAASVDSLFERIQESYNVMPTCDNVRERFQAFYLMPIAEPVLEQDGSVSGVVFPLCDNLTMYSGSFLNPTDCGGPSGPTYESFEKAVVGWTMDIGFTDATTMNLFYDVAKAYVDAVKGLDYAVKEDGKVVSSAVGERVKDLWSKVVAAKRTPTKVIAPPEDRKD